MSLAELKNKANAVTTAEALNAINGGTAVVCHDGKCFVYKPLDPIITKLDTI